jgi:glycerol kinase
VPAFVGLGAPYWNPNVRGGLFGLTRNTGPKELARAALESVCYQTHDLWTAMQADWPDAALTKTVLRVDGGMAASDWTMQRLADIIGAEIDRPSIRETTAFGAAYLAGLSAGVWPEPQRFADQWRLERRFMPAMDVKTRDYKLDGWRRAVAGVLAAEQL